MASDTELRDQLAVDRTLLANERTLLAYARTALALVGAGVGLLQFVDTPPARVWGWIFIAAGVLTGPLGLRRFLLVRRHLHRYRQPRLPA